MKKTLTKNQIEYVFFHLKKHMTTSNKNWFDFERSDQQVSLLSGDIIFPLSDRAYDEGRVFWKEEVPMLFPLGNANSFYCIEDNKLVFNHDILKSIFYLLSGYQEYISDVNDEYGRFPYSGSIQKRLGIISKPIVNYYFDIIISGFEEYSRIQDISIPRLRLFENFAFALSHDVDRVAFYHIRETLFKLKQFFGFAPSKYSHKHELIFFAKGILKYLGLWDIKDPWWNFRDLMDLEKSLGIRSSFYFLENQTNKKDSYYSFNNKKIKDIVKNLVKDKFEVGIHGPFASAYSADAISSSVDNFKESFNFTPLGVRQHYLRFDHPNTFKYQQQAGIKYDTSLSFAEHEGFRNSYCAPFYPYDFENDCMIDIVEVPLIVMEVTWLNYRELTKDEIFESLNKLLSEVKKFGGVFTLLWHNCRLEEVERPGVNQLYSDILEEIIKHQPECLTGQQICKQYISKSLIKY
ncbi:polysaccharide deacetylase family protein [bacterium]|nr:polysaccharide deacetylase family protein [bacterium]